MNEWINWRLAGPMLAVLAALASVSRKTVSGGYMQRECEHCGAKIELRLDIPYERGWKMCLGCRIKRRCDAAGDCWIWQGAKRGNYGVIRVKEGGDYALRNVHRAAYAVWRGEVPAGLSVLHSCRHYLCCNPEHLYLKKQSLGLEASELNYEAMA